MAQDFGTYDPAAIELVVGGQVITGYMDGTFVTTGRDEDSWTSFTGSGGETSRTRNRNQTGFIEVTLMQTSPSNDVLSAMMELDEQSGIPPGAIMLRDVLGTTICGGDRAYIAKRPDEAFAKDFQGRVWRFKVPTLKGRVGGRVV